ncbi:MAG: hypothetical protein QNL04_14200 [SAR324 cluster bacterium]|nr:hypothetical protein [SAR324 cluster bacterium]
MTESIFPLKTYTSAECVQFVIDMQAINQKLFHYKGRFSWQGPAVWVADNTGLKMTLDFSTNPAQWDRYKDGYVVFPVRQDVGVEMTANESH